MERTLGSPSLAIVVLLAGACATDSPSRLSPAAAPAVTPEAAAHDGPAVVRASTGPARYAGAIHAAFDAERAMDAVRYFDRYYRDAASEGYEASLDYLSAELERAGFGRNPWLELREIVQEMDHLAWTPRRARLTMQDGGQEVFLHGFEDVAERDRCMLPAGTPSATVEGDVVFRMHEVGPGKILVTEALLRADILRRAHEQGAAAVLSKYLYPFNVDPTGADRHLDALQYRGRFDDMPLPVAQISPRAYDRMAQVYVRDGTARVRFEAEVATARRPLRTLVAAIRGRGRETEAIAVAAHLQEPGACDNATGAAGILEGARVLARLLDDGDLPWPSRTIVFVWGEEMNQSDAWLEDTERTPIAGISADMIGQSRARTGAVALLERAPDPGAVTVLPPDVHTPWGADPVVAEDLRPHGLNVVARCALVDVDAVSGGGWTTREHPWEGGSDHDRFLGRGLPAVLFWHFTDFAYHTSLDRLENVDPTALRRMASAILATAAALADPREEDLERYLRCVMAEEELRVAAAERAGKAETAELWRTWCRGARDWLRSECLRLPVERATATVPTDR